MNDNFELKLVGMILFAIVMIVLLFIMYHMQKNELIAKADNPIATACAVSDSDSKPCMAYLGSLK